MDLRGKNIEQGYFNLVTVEGESNSTSGKLQDGQGSDLGNVSVGGLSFNNTDSELKVPVGTTAERPATPASGMIRWNTSTSTMELYDGSAWQKITVSAYVGAWATTSSMNIARRGLGGVGTVDDALSFGGYISSSSNTTETWNGSTWSTTSALNQARYFLGGAGTSINAISFGGSTGAAVATTEKWGIS